jgi:hypothetical protein
MTRYAMVFAALLISEPVSAQDPLAPIAPESGGLEVAPPVTVQKVQECAGEKFVFAWGVGARPTRVTLCAARRARRPPTSSPCFEDAAGQDRGLVAPRRPPDRHRPPDAGARSPSCRARTSLRQHLRSAGPTRYASPPTPVAPPVRIGLPRLPRHPSLSGSRFSRFAPPNGPATNSVQTPASSSAAMIARPDRLRAVPARRCWRARPGLAVTALWSAVPAGASLRFVRSGRDRAELDLGAMRKGQSTNPRPAFERSAPAFVQSPSRDPRMRP